jgi:hypothetical protein
MKKLEGDSAIAVWGFQPLREVILRGVKAGKVGETQSKDPAQMRLTLPAKNELNTSFPFEHRTFELARDPLILGLVPRPASSYRVTWLKSAPDAEPVIVGLFTDLAVTLSGLPSGQSIKVSVSARNATGETVPAEKTIIVL